MIFLLARLLFPRSGVLPNTATAPFRPYPGKYHPATGHECHRLIPFGVKDCQGTEKLTVFLQLGKLQEEMYYSGRRSPPSLMCGRIIGVGVVKDQVKRFG